MKPKLFDILSQLLTLVTKCQVYLKKNIINGKEKNVWPNFYIRPELIYNLETA